MGWWPRRGACPSDRGNIVATLAPPDASDASANPRNMDDQDARGSIWQSCTRLRALWGVFPVVVRVHSGAFVVVITTILLQIGMF